MTAFKAGGQDELLPAPGGVQRAGYTWGMALVFFDDDHPSLSPLTDLRPSFDVRTGALTTLERLERSLGLRIAALVVPDRLSELTRERHGVPVNAAPRECSDEVLIVNGRCPLDEELISTLR